MTPLRIDDSADEAVGVGGDLEDDDGASVDTHTYEIRAQCRNSLKKS